MSSAYNLGEMLKRDGTLASSITRVHEVRNSLVCQQKQDFLKGKLPINVVLLQFINESGGINTKKFTTSYKLIWIYKQERNFRVLLKHISLQAKYASKLL